MEPVVITMSVILFVFLIDFDIRRSFIKVTGQGCSQLSINLFVDDIS